MPLHKGKPDRSPAGFRTVFIQQAMCRLYSSVLESDLVDELEASSKLGDFQFGGRRGRGTVDAVLLLRTLIE